MMSQDLLFCANCSVKYCAKKLDEEGEFPRTCPSTRLQINDYVAEYEQDPVTWKLASISGETTMHDHDETRMQQVVRFAKAYGCRKIGLAFCISLSEEARMTANVLRKEGFEVESVICKVGRFDRKCVGVNDPRLKPMCNPVAQAEYLNEAGCDLNLVIGLCVGHDALFFRHSKAPAVCLIAKDHIYHHAPAEFFRSKEYQEKYENV